MAFIYLSLYLILNILYSIWLKKFPLIDIMILVSGFLIRLLYGAVIVNTYVSAWLYLTVMSGAFYLVLGKRRNEIKISTETNTRTVLKKYSYNFLDKFMYTCLTMTCVFYAIWSKEYHDEYMILTFPIVLLIFMQYSLIIEGDSDGDPVEVILKNKTLIILCILYIIVLFGILFF